MDTILIIVIIVLLLGGGGYYAHGRYGGLGWAEFLVWRCSFSCCSGFSMASAVWAGLRPMSGPNRASSDARRGVAGVFCLAYWGMAGSDGLSLAYRLPIKRYRSPRLALPFPKMEP
jgi:hypothetical protein